jgi:hypothetical protein
MPNEFRKLKYPELSVSNGLMNPKLQQVFRGENISRRDYCWGLRSGKRSAVPDGNQWV